MNPTEQKEERLAALLRKCGLNATWSRVLASAIVGAALAVAATLGLTQCSYVLPSGHHIELKPPTISISPAQK